MTRTLLEKTRKINRMLQNSDAVEFYSIADLLRDVIGANIFIVGVDGQLKGYSLNDQYSCDILHDMVIAEQAFPRDYVDVLLSIKDTQPNIKHADPCCSLVPEAECKYADNFTSIVPIYGNGSRLGTLVVGNYAGLFDDNDILLSEYAATVVGVQILHDQEVQREAETRQKMMVQIAFSTLSYSELEAIINILKELDSDEGLLVASQIADRVGITRSVIVNALRKFESANLIETRSLGMKGTYIHVKNKYVFEEISRHR